MEGDLGGVLQPRVDAALTVTVTPRARRPPQGPWAPYSASCCPGIKGGVMGECSPKCRAGTGCGMAVWGPQAPPPPRRAAGDGDFPSVQAALQKSGPPPPPPCSAPPGPPTRPFGMFPALCRRLIRPGAACARLIRKLPPGPGLEGK